MAPRAAHVKGPRWPIIAPVAETKTIPKPRPEVVKTGAEYVKIGKKYDTARNSISKYKPSTCD